MRLCLLRMRIENLAFLSFLDNVAHLKDIEEIGGRYCYSFVHISIVTVVAFSYFEKKINLSSPNMIKLQITFFKAL